MLGYQLVGDYPGAILVPAPFGRQPKAGDWRVKRSRKVIDGEGKRVFNANGNAIRVPERGAAHQKQVEQMPMRGVRRHDNSDNPLALGSKVFDSIENIDRRESDGPNAQKKRGLITCIAMAVETGSISLDDLDEKTRRRVERAMS